jgi:TonB family protein
VPTRAERARFLARTLARPRPGRDPVRAGWSTIAAVWVHLGLFAVLAAIAAPKVLERRLVVIRVAPPPAVAVRAPEPADDAPLSTRYLPTRPEDRASRPPDVVVISARDTVGDQAASAPVTSPRDGLPTPITRGPSDRPSSPSWDRRPGDLQAALGNRAHGDPGPIPIGGGGGGADGDGVSEAEAGAGASGRGPGSGGRPGGSGLPVGPDPSRFAGPSNPDRAPDAARPRASDAGGLEQVGAAEPALPTDPQAHVGLGRIAAPGTADPVDELREALGFGPLDRSKLAPRPEWAGKLSDDGLADSSPQVALADLHVDWQTSVSTRETPLGQYIARATAAIDARWRTADLDPHSRALGIQGDVTVRYLIHPDGRTSDVVVVRKSGNPTLDQLAIQAIPARLDRFPRELGKTPIIHEITLRYRNPTTGP